ncbi:unnamed protein product [Arctia plantaginis]|uniref:RING-type E3 ubiquitin transferase n=1 Tax=Arctia plantaginis TaxID=874455 RepID=A0A8S0ZEI0_ARCPL|nr:unnamed protein product [Arctia plantaginis]CAB3237430.1 unnamed protein product [Arctia plantaginis]
MAAKSKKRLSKIENKLLKLENLELKDVICSICQSILIEPVTLPCFHDFCQHCFKGSIENNALCCPLCRLRIGSWLRTATKQKSLVNIKLWNFIRSKFSHEIDIKSKGEDIHLPQEAPLLRLSKPGEIRSEYEAEIRRLRLERQRLEEKHIEETELLIKKLQQEEEEAHKNYLESLKHDEILAQEMHKEQVKSHILPCLNSKTKCLNPKSTVTKAKLKVTKIDSYLSKMKIPSVGNSPLLTDDNTSTDSSTPKVHQSTKSLNGPSPEIVPSYGKLIKSFIDKRVKNAPSLWNKENGDAFKEKNEDPSKQVEKGVTSTEDMSKVKSSVPSLLVSLPYTGILQHKFNVADNRNIETSSVDSMREELCYFKPIEATTPTSFNTKLGLPIRVPGVRVHRQTASPSCEQEPTRTQYLDGLCRLRHKSLTKNLSSAFVIAIDILKIEKEPAKCDTSRAKVKKTVSTSPCLATALPIKRNANRNKQIVHIEGIHKLNAKTNLRRTRSMGSISKDENETTPKKGMVKPRKVLSERKPYLRSDSKKSSTKKELSSPIISESLNNNKVNLAVKNLSSPLKNCDVKKILQEQLRIEKLIEQEKNDFEFARKMEAEWNCRRHPRRATIKRQVTLNYALRPAKKLKV